MPLIALQRRQFFTVANLSIAREGFTIGHGKDQRLAAFSSLLG